MSYTQRVARDFSAAASHYDDFAALQRSVVDSLLPWVPKEKAARVLDAGAGTGYAMQEGWFALDIAEGMCQTTKCSICADMQHLPIESASFDGVFSSLAMQWLDNCEGFLSEAHRSTKPGGWLVAATLGPKTLQSLREAFIQAGLFAPLLPFQAQKQLEMQLKHTKWSVLEVETQVFTTSQPNVRALLHHLKGLGARYKVNSSAGLRGKEWLLKLEEHYPLDLNNKINIEWEVIKIKANKG